MKPPVVPIRACPRPVSTIPRPCHPLNANFASRPVRKTAGVKVGRRDVKFTHPDKVLFPEAGLTKLDLARHYERLAPVMLPYVKDHPLALQSYPGGIDAKGFFMKAVP